MSSFEFANLNLSHLFYRAHVGAQLEVSSAGDEYTVEKYTKIQQYL